MVRFDPGAEVLIQQKLRALGGRELGVEEDWRTDEQYSVSVKGRRFAFRDPAAFYHFTEGDLVSALPGPLPTLVIAEMGVIHTPMLDRLFSSQPAAGKTIAAMEPVGRLGKPEEIAAALFAVLPRASELRRRHNDLLRQPLNVTLHGLGIARDRANYHLLHAGITVPPHLV
jgi:hypothetical protein